ITASLGDGVDLIVDGGVRRKYQQATFFNYFNNPFFVYDIATAAPANYVDTAMTTVSLTPRLDVSRDISGMPLRLLTGIDLYTTQYASDRAQQPLAPVIHHYDIRQSSEAVYGMATLTLRPELDVS